MIARSFFRAPPPPPCLPPPLSPATQPQSGPSPKQLGLLPDAFALLLGARGLALLLAPCVCPMPLLPNLAVAAFSVYVSVGPCSPPRFPLRCAPVRARPPLGRYRPCPCAAARRRRGPAERPTPAALEHLSPLLDSLCVG